jgi:hypothetical protein
MKKNGFVFGLLAILLLFGLVFTGCGDIGDTSSLGTGDNTDGSNTGGSNTGGSNTGGSNTGGSNTDGSNTGGGDETSDNVYVGVVAFNDSITTSEISNDLGKAKSFITSKTNNVDKTALCYAVSKAIPLFDKAGLPSFDYKYIVTFTDGADNGSSSLYVTDGQAITQTGVYNKANTDLSAKPGLKSYAIGFTGNETINATDMQKLVIGGQYKTANSGYDLEAVFKGIANSVLASSKNVTLQTNTGLFTEEEPKYIRLTISSSPSSDSSYSSYTDIITGKLVYNMGQAGATPVFTITTAGSYTTFDAPVTGTVSSDKILLPLNNLKQVRGGTEYFIKSIKVEVSANGTTWRVDTEDSSTSEDISKTIGVVLVMDCSASLGTTFSSVQTAAKNFIDTLNGK